MGSDAGTSMGWLGLVTPAASAAEKVTSLNTDPGS